MKYLYDLLGRHSEGAIMGADDFITSEAEKEGYTNENGHDMERESESAIIGLFRMTTIAVIIFGAGCLLFFVLWVAK